MALGARDRRFDSCRSEMECGRKGRRLDLAQKSVGSSPATPAKREKSKKKDRKMRRVIKAYEREKKYVERRGAYESKVEKRVSRGYRRGYEKEATSREGVYKRKVQLSYRENGQPGRRQRRELNHTVSARERWGRRSVGGTGRRETSEGRRTVEEARKQEIGGQRVRWVI